MAGAAFACSAGGARAESAWFEIDAANLGRGGIWALSCQERAPGATIQAGVGLGLSAAQPFEGTELTAAGIRLRLGLETWGGALALRQLRSPVHRETELALALQRGRAALRLGAGVRVRTESFEGYPTLWELGVCLGAGAELARGMRASVALDRPAGAGVPPNLVLAAETPLAGDLTVALQYEREPGLPARLLAGLSLKREIVRLLAGCDIAAQSTSAGVVFEGSRLHVAWAVASHAELGWSQAWTCEFWR